MDREIITRKRVYTKTPKLDKYNGTINKNNDQMYRNGIQNQMQLWPQQEVVTTVTTESSRAESLDDEERKLSEELVK